MATVDYRDFEATAENAAKLFPAKCIGPVWQKDTFGQWLMPEHTLGWEVIAWAEMNLNAIRGAGKLQLTPEQMRVTLWYYALDDEGDFSYRQAVYQAFKGSGKDPFAAVLAIVELVGPCRFSHWEYDSEGNKTPVAMDEPDAWVQLVGTAKHQTNNTMSMIPKLLGKKVRAEYGLDVQKEIVYANHGERRLEMVGANFATLEGNRVTFAVLNETQHWIPSQGGPALYDTIYDNVAKTNGRFLCITNAFQPGQDSIAERIRNEQEKVWAGASEDSGWLYMSLEAHEKAPLDPEWVPFIMDTIIGDSWWQRKNIKNLVKKVLDGARSPSRTRRMYYNQVVTSEDAFFSPGEWDGARALGTIGTEQDLKAGDAIVLGFDGGSSDDATALVALRISDKLIVPILVEQKPQGWPKDQKWLVDRQLVNEEVGRVFATYQVKAFFADVNLWESYIATWSETYRDALEVKASATSAIGWDMRGSKEKVSAFWDLFEGSILDGRLKHNGDGQLRVHALNAKRGHNGKGLIARKESPESTRKIDLMVAAYVAFVALQSLIERGSTDPRRHVRQRRNGPSRSMVRQ